MKRVLIILYYWPPSGGGGVQRWLKFSKYLPENGWEPIVYAPANADYPYQDQSLEADIPDDLKVIKHTIWEPYQLFSKFSGKKKRAQAESLFQKSDKEQGLKEKLAVWIRGNFFIPDARKFWIKPSVRYLSRWLKENKVDAIISTGTPHSIHLIALRLKRKFGLPWVADFRDPWTKIEYHESLRLSKMAANTHKRLEKAVVTSSDAVVTVSWSWQADMKEIGAQQVATITNGYDPEDFTHEAPQKSGQFLISHLGTFGADRNEEALWKALKTLLETVPGLKQDLKLLFVGRTDPQVIASLKAHGLGAYLETRDYVPHAEAIKIMQMSRILLLPLNNVSFNVMGRIAGKVFEYLAAQTPVLCIGPPEGDSAKILKETGGGVVCDFGQEAQMKAALENWYHQFKAGKLGVDGERYQTYSRPALSQKLAEILNHITSTDK